MFNMRSSFTFTDSPNISEVTDHSDSQNLTGADTEELSKRCGDVLPLLCSTNEFNETYWTIGKVLPDCYVFTHKSPRCLVLEVIAKFDPAMKDAIGTELFTSNKLFEDVLQRYTNSSTKPNQVLLQCRPLDIALTMIMKVEEFTPETTPLWHFYLLKREYAILNHIWESYRAAHNFDFTDMNGIPMVFDYKQIQDPDYEMEQPQAEELNLFGQCETCSTKTKYSTLSYMTMEKLGPKLSYLVDIVRKANRRNFDFSSALKAFDQLICRLQQIHKHGVVHNAISPDNLYFGHGFTSNMLYVSGFNAACRVNQDSLVKQSVRVLQVLKSERFAALELITSSKAHPIMDIESAFYILLYMTCYSLPWDQDKIVQSSVTIQRNRRAPSIMGPKRAKDIKHEFWESDNAITRMCLAYAVDAPLLGNVLSELYNRIRDLRQMADMDIGPGAFCKQLSQPNSKERRIYTELRQCVLVCFKFNSIDTLFNDVSFQKLVDSWGITDQNSRVWNLLDWCFFHIEVRTPYSVKLQQAQAQNLIRGRRPSLLF